MEIQNFQNKNKLRYTGRKIISIILDDSTAENSVHGAQGKRVDKKL